jgi:hypothetical protein
MKARTFIAVAIAGALAAPVAAFAQAGGPAGTSAQGSGVTGGVPRTGGPGPGMASMGEPQDFNRMDRDSDGRVSRAEWDEHYRGKASAGGTSSGNPATTDHTSAPSTTGTTAGPGSVSPRTGPGSATATRPSTSGHGKAQ